MPFMCTEATGNGIWNCWTTIIIRKPCCTLVSGLMSWLVNGPMRTDDEKMMIEETHRNRWGTEINKVWKGRYIICGLRTIGRLLLIQFCIVIRKMTNQRRWFIHVDHCPRYFSLTARMSLDWLLLQIIQQVMTSVCICTTPPKTCISWSPRWL